MAISSVLAALGILVVAGAAALFAVIGLTLTRGVADLFWHPHPRIDDD